MKGGGTEGERDWETNLACSAPIFRAKGKEGRMGRTDEQCDEGES